MFKRRLPSVGRNCADELLLEGVFILRLKTKTGRQETDIFKYLPGLTLEIG